MFTPNGQSADKMDKIMLLALWAEYVSQQSTSDDPMIFAGMGRPTFPINSLTCQFMLEYWADIYDKSKPTLNSNSAKAAISYGNPQGDIDAREKMAQALSSWYEHEINPRDVLFTTGGAAGIHVILQSLDELHKECPNYRIVTPFPYYTLYSGSENHLHPIHVMESPGYRLTAKAVINSFERAYELAKIDGGKPKALLLCEPNNPLGTTINKDELLLIASYLKNHPDVLVILDEAYAEMCLSGERNVSLFTVAPELHHRMIVMRSATKALSAAGERMAVLVSKNEAFLSLCLAHHIQMCGHAPRSLQAAYAQTMLHFSKEQHKAITEFYRPKVAYIHQRLKEIGAAMPDMEYSPDATFYVLADLSDLLELPLIDQASRALNRTGLIRTDEDIVYSLMFQDNVMLSPLSYFGMPANKGFVRITCSDSLDTLSDLIKRLERRLVQARLEKNKVLKEKIVHFLQILRGYSEKDFEQINNRLQLIESKVLNHTTHALELKNLNSELESLYNTLSVHLKKVIPAGREQASVTIQSFFRECQAKKRYHILLDEENKHWLSYVDRVAPNPGKIRTALLTLSKTERQEYRERMMLESATLAKNYCR